MVPYLGTSWAPREGEKETDINAVHPQHPARNWEPGEKFQVKHDKRFKYAKHGQKGDKRCLVLPALLPPTLLALESQ